MTLKTILLAVGIASAVNLGTSALAFAHGPDANSANQLHSSQMAPMMRQMPMTGPGMMGQGMGPGMIGQGMMGQGMMGQGMGPGMMQPLRQDLSAKDVEHMMEHRLAWNGNPNVKVGKVEEKDDDAISVEIVTKDGSLVQSLIVDRHTGWMRPAR